MKSFNNRMKLVNQQMSQARGPIISANSAKYYGRDIYEQSALDHINAIRAEFYLPSLKELPKGRRKSPTGCVIANGLPDRASAGGSMTSVFVRGEGDRHFVHSTLIAQFVANFDAGKYPHLVS